MMQGRTPARFEPVASAADGKDRPPRLATTDALFLDFDGTLVEIAAHPTLVTMPVHLPTLLAALRAKLGGAVAILSGRALADLDHHLSPFRFAGAGVHGLELRDNPKGPICRLGPRIVATAVAALEAFARRAPGVWVENKGQSAALHFRTAPESAEACLACARQVSLQYGLQLLQGKYVLELKTATCTKGSALQVLMRSDMFASRRPVVVGDDMTDEDAFIAAQDLGGWGIRIGGGATAAAHRLPDVRSLLGWLSRHAGRPWSKSFTE